MTNWGAEPITRCVKFFDGEIAATVLVAGKPTISMYGLKRSDGLTFLPIPYSDEIGVDFTPVQLTHDDHPEMIQLGEKINTIADGAVLNYIIGRKIRIAIDEYNLSSTLFFLGSRSFTRRRTIRNGMK